MGSRSKSRGKPGAAAKKLIQLMRRLPKHRGRKTNVSERVKEDPLPLRHEAALKISQGPFSSFAY
jgi:hypothetical protein